MMENQLHSSSCFITLTYDDAHLPAFRTLVKKDLQDFMKRLRKSLHPVKVRFYAVGEYGETTARPHYHIILFGTDFSSDRKMYKNGRHPLYQSKILTAAWNKGHANFGDVTFESAAYCARYCLKKVNSHKQDYDVACDVSTGEVYSRIPEFSVMSRRPGIAAEWYDRFGSDVRRTDVVVMRGKAMKPPRYFDKLYQELFPDDFADLKAQRACNLEYSHVTLEEFSDLGMAAEAREHLQSAISRRT